MSSESERKGPELPASWEAIVRRIAREVAVEVVKSAEANQRASWWGPYKGTIGGTCLGVPGQYVDGACEAPWQMMRASRREQTPEGAIRVPVHVGEPLQPKLGYVPDISEETSETASHPASRRGDGRAPSRPAEAPNEPGNSLGLGCPARSSSTPVDPVGSCTPAAGPEEAGNSSSAIVCTCCCACPLGMHGMPDSVRAIERCNVHGYLELRTCPVHFVKPEDKDCADHGPPKEAAAPASQGTVIPAPQRGTATGALSEDSEEFRLASMYFAEFHDQHAALANDFRAYGDARVREATAKLREAAEAMVRLNPNSPPGVRAWLLDEIKKASGG